MLTLAQAKQENAIYSIAGVSVSSPQYIAYLNQACRQLMNQGEWHGTVKAMVGQTYRGCVIWPQGVDAVLAVNTGRHHARIANYWYEFVPMDGRMANILGQCNHPTNIVRFSGTVPVFNNPTATNPFAIQASADSSADYGKTITIYGQDTNGAEVLQVRPDGSTQRGYQMTLAGNAPFTTVAFSNISAVAKDVTVGNVRLWVYQPNGIYATPVAIYTGPETMPQYLFSNLAGNWHQAVNSVEALVKLKFQPVSQDSDILSIENVDAIAAMVHSIRYREAGDKQQAQESFVEAIRLLNSEIRTKFPDQQSVMRVEAVMGKRIKNPV